VAAEDKESLEESGFTFNVHALIGGQLAGDRHHRLYLIYPQGNWVEVGEGTPYHIIGASGYGKPVLDRTLKYDDTLRFALKVGCLAFDSTRISAADVNFPIDVLIYVRDSYQTVMHRYDKSDLLEISDWWQDRLRKSVRELSLSWIEPLLEKLPDPSLLPLKLADSHGA
jgi:putative proteasome-type protease